MNRTIPLLNLFGVLLLVGLCALQWLANRAFHLQLQAQATAIAQQANQITAQQKAINSQRADLDDFRARIAAAEKQSQEDAVKIRSLTAENISLTSARDEIQNAYNNVKTALDKWMAAVTERDESLKKANTLAQQLATDRNEAITKYNQLAAQFNTANAELKIAANTIRLLATQRDEAIRKFNDLATRYNALVTSASTTKPE